MRVAYFGQFSLTQVILHLMDCLTSKESAQSRMRGVKELDWRTENGVIKTPNKHRGFHHNLCPTQERGPIIRASLRMNPSPSLGKLKMVKVREVPFFIGRGAFGNFSSFVNF